MARFIGIRHRVKKTAQEEAHPTMVAIMDRGRIVSILELEDDEAELDFVECRFPTKWRSLGDGEDTSKFLARHVKMPKKGKEGPTKVPAAYDGLAPGDTIAMVLGGSGDRFAYALSRKGEALKTPAKVLRIPAFILKEKRGEATKDDDHETLARLVEEEPSLFYEVGPRGRDFIRMCEAHRARRYTQKDRICCEQRLRQHVIGRIFLSEDGHYPEGKIEDEYDREKANDVILTTLLAEEAKRESELKSAVRALDVWSEVFAPIEGCGEVLAAGLMSPIGDIRRFEVAPDFTDASTPEERKRRINKAAGRSKAKLKKFCGVHVLPDGSFPRKRKGHVANWTTARQALYLLGAQFVYRPESEWGKRYREYKVKFREKHPAPIVAGKVLVSLFREIERLFLLHGVKVAPDSFDLRGVDGVYEYFRAGVTELENAGLDSVLKELEEKIEEIGTSGGTAVKVYTPGHIHKMAIWRTLTKFVERLWTDWMRVETGRPARREEAAA